MDLVAILYYMKDALMLGVLAVSIYILAWVVGYPLIYKKLMHGEKPFPWKTAVLLLLIVGYLAMIAYVTLWRSEQSYTNLHLFRGYREAWNTYGRMNWENVLLNIAMFVPLGILLPLVVRYFRKFYWTFVAGFGISMLIELTQLIAKRGAFDVDDLFNNTLGTMLGFCLVMIVITLVRREKKKSPRVIMVYAALPIAVAACLSGAVIAYNAQAFGNLADACTYTVNMKNVDVNLACELDDSITTAAIYQAETFDIQSCDEYGYEFFDRLDVTPDDVAHYNDEAFFMKHSSPGYSLWVNYLGRTFSYKSFDTEIAHAAETDRSNLVALLLEFGVKIPEAAELTYDGTGRYIFSVSQYIEGNTIFNGTIICQYYDDDTLKSIDNNLITATYCRESNIITQSEAYNRLCAGQFLGGYFEYVAPSEMTITGVSLDYEVDSKGFYQPVYIFNVELHSVNSDVETLTITIPVLEK